MAASTLASAAHDGRGISVIPCDISSATSVLMSVSSSVYSPVDATVHYAEA